MYHRLYLSTAADITMSPSGNVTVYVGSNVTFSGSYGSCGSPHCFVQCTINNMAANEFQFDLKIDGKTFKYSGIALPQLDNAIVVCSYDGHTATAKLLVKSKLYMSVSVYPYAI